MELVFDYTRLTEPIEPLLECVRFALAHELPNQLVAIQGLARLAGPELAAGDGGEGARALLGRLGGQARRADCLCRALAHVITLHRPAKSVPVSLTEEAREAGAIVRCQFPARPPEVCVAGGLPELTVPPRTLYHVYVELMRNAAAASPGRVCINIGGRRQPEGVSFWVADDGPGLPGDRPERWFEPFTRHPPSATHATSPTGRGAEGAEPFGLGLFLVRQVVACWHGSLHVRSAPGRGTSFTFFVPQADDAEGGRA